MNDTARRVVDSRMKRGDRRPMHEYDERRYRGDYREPERDGRYMRERGGEYEERHEHHERREELSLPRHEMREWKRRLKNADGTTGEHFTAEQMHEASHQVGATFEEYDEAELCMAANMLYSDLCEALRVVIPKDREAMMYAKMARYWLEDEDGPKGSEKLALYFYCIVEDE